MRVVFDTQTGDISWSKKVPTIGDIETLKFMTDEFVSYVSIRDAVQFESDPILKEKWTDFVKIYYNQ